MLEADRHGTLLYRHEIARTGMEGGSLEGPGGDYQIAEAAV
jgi:hypothetical protein